MPRIAFPDFPPTCLFSVAPAMGPLFLWGTLATGWAALDKSEGVVKGIVILGGA